MKLDLKKTLAGLQDADCSFIEEAREKGKALKVGETAFVKNSDYTSEYAYKRAMAKNPQPLLEREI